MFGLQEQTESLAADCSQGDVPGDLRYAHHSDFVRLDALLARGGVHADIDTIFVRPSPDDLLAQPFMIAREPVVRDGHDRGPAGKICSHASIRCASSPGIGGTGWLRGAQLITHPPKLAVSPGG